MKKGTRKQLKRWHMVFFCLCMLFSSAVTSVQASEEPTEEISVYTGGLCEHHPEHTADCGYMEAKEGTPCSHVHDESCGYIAGEVPEQENSEHEPVQACPHVSGEHDASCGYEPAAEGQPCTFVCEFCSAEVKQNTESAQSESDVEENAQSAGEYSADSEQEFQSVLKQIESQQEQTNFVIVLKNDITLSDGFAGLEGKQITLQSEADGNYRIKLANELKGDITLDNVASSFESSGPVFANGHRFETTTAYKGKIGSLYGGRNKSDLEGDTNLILGGGTFDSLHGGGLDSAVQGDVSITIDGPDVRVGTLYGGGHAKESQSGTVSGNVTVCMRQGSNGFLFGGGDNSYSVSDNDGDRTPASVAGTVTVTLGYPGAPDKSVWPGTAMFAYAGSNHSTVGNIVLNVTDGFSSENSGGDRNLFGCGYNDTVLGTVEIHIYGSPDIGSSFIYGGGNTEGNSTWPVCILNQENKAYALQVTYDVPSEMNAAAAGHGINAGSNESLPTTINGNIRIELKHGNMDFLVLDNENAGNLTVNGNSEILIHEGRVAQVQGNKAEYDSDETNYTTTAGLTGECEIGYFYRFDEVGLQDSSEILVDSTRFEQFGSAQKPFFSVDNLVV